MGGSTYIAVNSDDTVNSQQDSYGLSASGDMEAKEYDNTGSENNLRVGCYYEKEQQSFTAFLLVNFFLMFIGPLIVSIVFECKNWTNLYKLFCADIVVIFVAWKVNEEIISRIYC